MTVSGKDFLNETEFENDPFSSVPEDEITDGYSKVISTLGYYLIITSIMKLILILAVIISNIFLTIVIFRFKRLRAVRINTYILHISIIITIYYLCSPLFYLLYHLFSDKNAASTILVQTQMTLLTAYITISMIMAFDWFLSASKPIFMKKIHQYDRYMFMGIYTFFFIEWSIAFIYSEVHHIARTSIFILFYLLCLLLMIIINILKRFVSLRSESKKTEYALMVTNIIIFSYVPIFAFHVLFIVFDSIASCLIYLEILPEILEIGHPILIIYLLGKKNKYFEMAYFKCFKRSVRSYQDEDLDEISVEEEQGVVNNIEVPLNINEEI